jgi:hypothetical protein
MTLPMARDLARAAASAWLVRSRLASSPRRCWPGCPKRRRRRWRSKCPFPPRLGHPTEYAALAMHIIENPMLNGEVIRLDGAIRMGPK